MRASGLFLRTRCIFASGILWRLLYVPNFISNLEKIAKILPTNSIIIARSAAIGAAFGEVLGNTNLDIWCSSHALSHLCHLLAAKGLVLMRFAWKYGPHSHSLISHVEQHCL